MRGVILFTFCLTQVLAGAGKPVVSIGINSEALDSGPVGALEPQIRWQTSGTYAGCDVSGGMNLKVRDVDDVYYGLWGTAKRTVRLPKWFDRQDRDIALSARADTESNDLSMVDLDLQATAPSTGTSVQLKGVVNVERLKMAVDNVRVSQQLNTEYGSFTVTPKYSVASSAADVKVSYGREDTIVTLDATKDNQKVTVNQVIGDNMVSPSFASNGDVELSYSRSFGQGSLTTTYKPNSHVGLTYEEGSWAARVTAPLEGLYKVNTDHAKFVLRTSVDVTTLGHLETVQGETVPSSK